MLKRNKYSPLPVLCPLWSKNGPELMEEMVWMEFREGLSQEGEPSGRQMTWPQPVPGQKGCHQLPSARLVSDFLGNCTICCTLWTQFLISFPFWGEMPPLGEARFLNWTHKGHLHWLWLPSGALAWLKGFSRAWTESSTSQFCSLA